MAREQLQCRGFSSASPDAVWAVAREFCGLWHPAVAAIAAEDFGQVRAFSVKGEGKTYRERLTYFSDSDRVLAYSHVEGIDGIERYDARMTVSAAEQGGSVIGWSATVMAPARRAAEVCAGTTGIFEAGLAALAARAEAGVSVVPEGALPEAVAMRTRLIDDLPRLAVDVAGQGETLCLFLHGIGGGRVNWDAQVGLVGGRMLSAALDLRGYGDSTLGPQQTTVDDYCADILRVMQVLGAKRLVLVGLSYGSWIATSFAMRHPEMLAGLVLSGGCTGMSEAGPDEREAFRVSREVPLNAGQVPADFAPAVVKVLAGPDADAGTRAALLASMAAIPAATYRDALMCFTNPLERFDFARLTMPVLLMTGEHDRLAPVSEIRAVAGRIWDMAARPDVRFEVIAGAGHVSNVEAPDAYSRHLLTFLGRLA